MKETELKPCPFCGGEAIFPENCLLTCVICIKCGATSRWCTSKEKAEEVWNRRADNEQRKAD